MADGLRERLHALGPGVLYAAIAVGASHLVQSTRAGANFGLGLVFLMLLTFIAKYPAFRFGAQYPSVTGKSLLHGYRRQGRWAVAIYGLVAVGTMFAAVPAVTTITAGLAQSAFHLPFSTMSVSIIILAACASLLLIGHYHWLDRIVKLLMVVLSLATVVATALVLPSVDWHASARLMPVNVQPADVFFIVALLGMMPSSVDISVWHSLWAIAKTEDDGKRLSLARVLDDFHVGYVGAFLLAFCFVLLGTGLMYQSGREFATSATGFAEQLIGLYTQALGAWSRPLIGTVAVAVMLSTVLTGLDGYARVAVGLLRTLRREQPTPRQEKGVYALALLTLIAGTLLVLAFLVTSLTLVVDVAATLIFLFAPVIAWLNHRVMFDVDLPAHARPGPRLWLLSMTGIGWMGLFSAYFLYLRFLT